MTEALNPLKTLGIALLRTIVPVVVALLIHAAAKAGLELDSDTLTGVVTDVLTVAGTAAYYVGVRVLEHLKSSKWGWLLGFPSAPNYDKPDSDKNGV